MMATGVSSTSEKNVRMSAHMSPLRACRSIGGAATRVVGGRLRRRGSRRRVRRSRIERVDQPPPVQALEVDVDGDGAVSGMARLKVELHAHGVAERRVDGPAVERVAARLVRVHRKLALTPRGAARSRAKRGRDQVIGRARVATRHGVRDERVEQRIDLRAPLRCTGTSRSRITRCTGWFEKLDLTFPFVFGSTTAMTATAAHTTASAPTRTSRRRLRGDSRNEAIFGTC